MVEYAFVKVRSGKNPLCVAEGRLTKTQRLSPDSNHPPQLPRGAGEQKISRETTEELELITTASNRPWVNL